MHSVSPSLLPSPRGVSCVSLAAGRLFGEARGWFSLRLWLCLAGAGGGHSVRLCATTVEGRHPWGGVPMSFSSGHFEEPKSLVIQPERIMVLTDCTFSMPYSKPYNPEKQISTEKKSKNNQRAKRVSNQMQMTARGNLKFSAVCGHKTNEYQQPGKVKKEAQSTFSAQKDSILSGRGAHSSWGVCPSSCCGCVGGGFPVASLTRPHGGGFCL